MTDAQASHAADSGRPYDRWLYESIGEMRAETRRAAEDARSALDLARAMQTERGILGERVSELTSSLENVVSELRGVADKFSEMNARLSKEEARPRSILGFDGSAIRTLGILLGGLMAGVLVGAQALR